MTLLGRLGNEKIIIELRYEGTVEVKQVGKKKKWGKVRKTVPGRGNSICKAN